MLATAIEVSEKWHDNGLGAVRRPLRSSQGEAFINDTIRRFDADYVKKSYYLLKADRFEALTISLSPSLRSKILEMGMYLISFFTFSFWEFFSF